MSSAFDLLEPILKADEIQGNVLGGFNKDHQAVLPLHFGDTTTAIAAVRSWLSSVVLPTITWLPEVVKFKRRRRERLKALGDEMHAPQVVWNAIAFSFPGLRKLTEQADAFEPVFRRGLPAASFRLGDPQGAGVPGDVSTWKIGAPDRIPDALFIIAGDDKDVVQEAVDSFLATSRSFGIDCPIFDIGHDVAAFSTASEQFPGGREHFGFKDGVSQPGIRGRMTASATDFLTTRTMAARADPGSSEPEFSAPGQPLVCVGEFVFGYPRQLDNNGRRADAPWKLGPEPFAPDPTAIGPFWARNGSFLVYRRLRQDVPAFNRFLQDQARQLAGLPDFAGLTAEQLGTLLVGRWPSGAPVLRASALEAPAADNPLLGRTSGANNAFGFNGPEADPHDGFSPAVVDPFGQVCPQAAHIRKVNPRNLNTDQGALTATLVRRILRRGIPYGPPLTFGSTEDPTGDERGLLFLSYMTSIRDQFEFLSASWMNSPSKPTPQLPPADSGFDMIVGQNSRERFCLVGPQAARVSSTSQWVIPTGGGYFFAPSQAAIREVLAAGF
jgi:Dyp-type peroxidase family